MRVFTTALMFLGAVARASSPDGGRAAGIDLDLHQPFTAAPPRPAPGATLASVYVPAVSAVAPEIVAPKASVCPPVTVKASPPLFES